MSTSSNTANIISQLKKLDKEDQLNIFQQFKLMLEKTKDDSSHSFLLTSLTGLGNESWKDTDIDKFIDEERQW